MAMEYFCCYNDYLTKTRNLSDSELGRLFRALMTYSATGEKTQLNGREGMAFDFISIDIDTAKERYNAKCVKLKSNGEQANATKCHQMPPNAPQEKRKKKEEKDISFVSNDTQDISSSAKSAATRAKRTPSFSAKAYIENFTQDEELRGLLLEWLENRKKKRAPETEGAISKNLEKLPEMAAQSNLSLQDYMREVIRKGWQAFYPVHDEQAPATPRRQDGRDFDWLTGQ